MSAFETVIEILRNIGFFDIFLPLILIWALVYGILIRLQFFKKGNEVDTRLSSLVAFSIALIAVGSYQILKILQKILPYLGLAIVTIFAIIMIAGFTGGITYDQVVQMGNKWKALLGGGTAIVVFLWLLYILGYFNPTKAATSITNLQELIEILAGFAMLGAFIGMVWWLSKPEKVEQQQQQ